MSPTSSSSYSNTTKHSRIAETLAREIEEGKWVVSSSLPSETQLVARFGVSRQTVRSAIASLQARGLVSKQQGARTRVLRQEAAPEYSQSLESIAELAYYAQHTVVEVVRVEDVVMTSQMASIIGGEVGSLWCHAVTLRAAEGQKVPIGLSSVWVPEASRPAIQASRKSGLPVFLEIQKANKQMVTQVRQVLGASLPDKAQARLLHCDAREPLLRIQRWYYAADRSLFEMSDTLHPSSRFQYVMSLRHAVKNASQQLYEGNR